MTKHNLQVNILLISSCLFFILSDLKSYGSDNLSSPIGLSTAEAKE
jgi:hypothetical protein